MNLFAKLNQNDTIKIAIPDAAVILKLNYYSKYQG